MGHETRVRQRGANPAFLRSTVEWLLPRWREAAVTERIGAS
ncbi:protein of unknown function [Candidatus Hydrogenisulfobacillus filiaventi]|uniref:Uncharacterized protein n=1 Tax=Candidatus Hydrogenisulfobacillus filiaventi TaxID=2707344 RepID=A0A6F8ZCJ4_9FIRM|nr:hypothetical protein [Bacillota bacterium]CAB1127756.1 protein of unknown function [Candidatus Hydrogenisulfobacillus filiaventi]